MKLPGATHLVVLCTTQAQAQRALELISQWMRQAQLQLHPQKTKIIDAAQVGGFEFLGYHFERGHKWPRQKSVLKVREAIRKRTRRTNAQSLGCTIAGINPILRGWYNYFRHGKVHTLRNLDGWVRGRIRSILAQTNQTQRQSPRWTRSPPMAQALLRRGGAVQPDHSSRSRPIAPQSIIYSNPQPHCQTPIFWRAGCGKTARPVRREGRP